MQPLLAARGCAVRAARPSRHPARQWRRHVLRLLLAAAALAAVLLYLDWPRMGWYWLATSNHGAAPPLGQGMGLASYTVSVEAQPIEGLRSNASGLTYSAATGTLFAVLNRPPAVAELSTTGQLLRYLPLPWLGDPEGITHVSGDLFLISDEADNTLRRVRIKPGASSAQDAGPLDLPLDFRHWPNFGLEGVSWDETRQLLLLVNEKWPRKLIIVHGLTAAASDSSALQATDWRPRAWLGFLGRDLASLTSDRKRGNFVVLGEQSRLVAEYARNGDIVGMLPLRRGFAGLQRDVPQPEGITLAPDGSIYVLSEPNLLYRLDGGR